MKTLTLFLALALPALAADTTIIGKVVGVHDGDTLTLRTEDETLKVRLSGIDTPELGQPFGNNAKQALSRVATKRQNNNQANSSWEIAIQCCSMPCLIKQKCNPHKFVEYELPAKSKSLACLKPDKTITGFESPELSCHVSGKYFLLIDTGKATDSGDFLCFLAKTMVS